MALLVPRFGTPNNNRLCRIPLARVQTTIRSLMPVSYSLKKQIKKHSISWIKRSEYTGHWKLRDIGTLPPENLFLTQRFHCSGGRRHLSTGQARPCSEASVSMRRHKADGPE